MVGKLGLNPATAVSFDDHLRSFMFPSCQQDDDQQEQHDVTITELSAEIYSRSKNLAVVRGTLGITSIVASSSLICMILRSHEGLTTPFHRLLFGMCIFDIITSLSLSLFNFTTPKEDEYWIWNASGNTATCNFQGFLALFGTTGSMLYICCICMYYLLVVTYRKSDDIIRSKYERYLHGLPILIAAVLSLTPFIADGYQPTDRGSCWSTFAYDPPHCSYCEDGDNPGDEYSTDCGRGRESSKLFGSVHALILIASFLVIIILMSLMYRTVSKQERSMLNYGRASLAIDFEPEPSHGSSKLKGLMKYWWQNIGHAIMNMFNRGDRDQSVQLPVEETSQSRAGSGRSSHTLSRGSTLQRRGHMSARKAVFQKGLAYSMAYVIAFGPTFVLLLVENTGDYHSSGWDYVVTAFFTMQGIFNFLVFLYPKVTKAKKSKDISWCQAFIEALKSRGRNPNRNSRSSLLSSQRSSNTTRNNSNRTSRSSQLRNSNRITSYLGKCVITTNTLHMGKTLDEKDGKFFSLKSNGIETIIREEEKIMDNDGVDDSTPNLLQPSHILAGEDPNVSFKQGVEYFP